MAPYTNDDGGGCHANDFRAIVWNHVDGMIVHKGSRTPKSICIWCILIIFLGALMAVDHFPDPLGHEGPVNRGRRCFYADMLIVFNFTNGVSRRYHDLCRDTTAGCTGAAKFCLFNNSYFFAGSNSRICYDRSAT